MPLSSYQVSGLMSGQQQMFANYAAYAGQISPEGPPGMSGYGAPLSQQSPIGPPPIFDQGPFNAGPQAMAGMHAAMPAMMGAGILAGSFLPGALGRGIGRLDPFQAGLAGFGRASGLTSGIKAGAGMGEMFGGMAENLGRIGAGGLGNIARAGVVGLGGAAMAALPAFVGMKAVEFAGGQMVEGAQFTNQVQRTLGQNFRFQNPLSQTGYGFSREQGAEIAGTVRQMGNREIMSSPQEMLRIMEQGIQGGLFRPVQDAKAFQTKFKDMVGALKEIAKTFNTTLEGAMPFLQEGRRMGFWTPSDVMRMAASTRATAATTGMTVAQVQQMQEQGAGMARSIGAQGAMGALGMQRTMDVVGGGLRSGVISEQRMAELTGGLQGSEAIAALSGTLQAGTTRFASSRTARWLLAATANKSMTGLDEGRLGMLTSGRLGIDQIRGMAEKNVQGRGADFVMGEEEMRGELLKRGPEAQAGFIAGIAGKRLYGDSAMDKLVTRRLIQRYFGGDARQADTMAELARHMPQILRDNSRRAEAEADRMAMSHEEMMDHSYEGLKRKVTDWTKKFIEEPLQKAGSEFSQGIGDMWEKVTDKVWGRAPRGLRLGGVDRTMAEALRASALGDTKAMRRTFASAGEIQRTHATAESTQASMERGAESLATSLTGGTSLLQDIGMDATSGITGQAMRFLGIKDPFADKRMSGGQIIDMFKGPEADDFKKALVHFASGETGKGVGILEEMASKAEKNDRPEDAARYRSLAQNPAAYDKLAGMGGQQRRLNELSGQKEMQLRMGRARSAFAEGGHFQDRITALNEVKSGNGKSAGIGTLVQGMLTSPNLDLEQMQDKLKSITQAAMDLSPEQIATLVSQMSEPGMEALHPVTEALMGAGDLKGIKAAIGGKGGIGALSRELSGATDKLGLGSLSQQDIKALRSKKPTKEQQKLLESLTSRTEGRDQLTKGKWSKLLESVKTGDSAGMMEFATGAQAFSQARSGVDPGVDRLAAWRKDAGDKNILGKLGSSEGMHAEMTIQTSVLKEIRDNTKPSESMGTLIKDFADIRNLWGGK
jgi:hypothetical protein